MKLHLEINKKFQEKIYIFRNTLITSGVIEAFMGREKMILK